MPAPRTPQRYPEPEYPDEQKILQEELGGGQPDPSLPVLGQGLPRTGNRGIGAGSEDIRNMMDNPNASGPAFEPMPGAAPPAGAAPPPVAPPDQPQRTLQAAPPGTLGIGGLRQDGPGPGAGGAGGAGGAPPTDRVPGGASARYGTDNIPGAENLTWGDTSRLRGFNTNEWGEGGTEGYEDASIKNSFGKIASRYNPSPSGLREMVNDPDFQRLFPEARLVEGGAGDKIDFGDGRPVDVLISADPNADTAEGWAWQTMDDGGGGGAGGGGGTGPGGNPLAPGLGGIDQLASSDSLADILAQLQALSGDGRNDPMAQDLLQRLMTA